MIGDELKVPKALRPVADEIVAITDSVCLAVLDEEYADLARRAVAKLARKRPSPLTGGRRATWAAGVVYALGQASKSASRVGWPVDGAPGDVAVGADECCAPWTQAQCRPVGAGDRRPGVEADADEPDLDARAPSEVLSEQEEPPQPTPAAARAC